MSLIDFLLLRPTRDADLVVIARIRAQRTRQSPSISLQFSIVVCVQYPGRHGYSGAVLTVHITKSSFGNFRSKKRCLGQGTAFRKDSETWGKTVKKKLPNEL